MPSFTQRLAYRQLRAPQKASFVPFASVLAVAGLGIGVAALIITFSALEGFENTVSGKIAGLDGHVRIQHYFSQPFTGDSYNRDSLLNVIDVPFSSYKFVESPVLVRKGSVAEGALVTGIDANRVSQLEKIMTGGSPILQDRGIIIGDRLADMLSVGIDDEIVLMDFNSFNYLGSATRMNSFRIQGLFHSGLYEYDKSMIYMDLNDAQKLLGLDNAFHGEVFFLKDLTSASNLKRTLESRLGYPFYISTWKNKHQVLFDWMNLQKWPILIIFGMIAFVGLVNIMSALTMIILEKIRETGILLALGFRKRSVNNLFVLEGILIGVAGTALGLILAVLLIQIQESYQLLTIPEDIYFMDRIPLKLDPVWLGWIIAGSIISTILSALVPALRARKISPAKALRYE